MTEKYKKARDDCIVINLQNMQLQAQMVDIAKDVKSDYDNLLETH